MVYSLPPDDKNQVGTENKATTMIPAEETFNGTWPYAANFSTAAGFKQHYVDEGPRDGEIIICLHGEPTWGYLI